jgi:predicted dehydrogenase
MKTSLIVGMGIGQLYKKVLTELDHGVITVDADPSKEADFLTVDDAIVECRMFDTVHICTPNFTHMKIARKLAFHTSIMFIEKPGAANADAWAQLCKDYPRTRIMMVKNNMWRDNIAEMQEQAEQSTDVQLYWINRDRVPNPGSWFTTKSLSYGGVSRDLMPHLLSLYIALNPSWATDKISDRRKERVWSLDDLTQSDYGTVNDHGVYDVDDKCSVRFGDKWYLMADWRDTFADCREIQCDNATFELGLCPESAYKAMIEDAINNKMNQEFWDNQYSQDMWIHNIIDSI